MEFRSTIDLVEKGLCYPLPGKKAQIEMSPSPVDSARFSSPLSADYRKGSVLILFYPEGDQAFFPLIKRPIYPGIHSGQIALPGGKMDEEDKNEVETALREAWEEVGVRPEQVNLLGQLSPLFIPASNFLVSPIIGFSEDKPDFVAQEREVSRIIQTSVSAFYEPRTRKRKTLTFSEKHHYDTPYFEIDKEMVWGATAMILNELLQILENGKL